jgi:hypothetical protein
MKQTSIPPQRSMLIHGLRLMLGNPGAVVWTYAFNVGIALVFSMRLHAQLSALLSHSLAAERLNSAFDLGTLGAAVERMSHNTLSGGSTSNYLGLSFYLAVYFLLVPGTLFCYAHSVPSRLSIMASMGFQFFWRFVRITLLTVVISGVILGPLIGLNIVWSTYVEEQFTGVAVLLDELPGLILIALVAALLRLYFDLVEVYTIQVGDQFRPSGMPDRRVRRALLPALQTLRSNLARAYGMFLTLAMVGAVAVLLTGWIAVRTLAQPRVWPLFLLAQVGIFVMIATRFWQRAAETILVFDNPLALPAVQHELEPMEPSVRNVTTEIPDTETTHFAGDAQSDPEPAAPSLPEPDPGVFHHEPSSAPMPRDDNK